MNAWCANSRSAPCLQFKSMVPTTRELPVFWHSISAYQDAFFLADQPLHHLETLNERIASSPHDLGVFSTLF